MNAKLFYYYYIMSRPEVYYNISSRQYNEQVQRTSEGLIKLVEDRRNSKAVYPILKEQVYNHKLIYYYNTQVQKNF